MKRFLGWFFVLGLSAALGRAQQANEAEKLRQEIKQATDAFDKAVQEHRRNINALNKRLEALEKAQGLAVTNAPPAAAQPPASPATAAAQRPWRPSDPIRLAGGGPNYLNLSLDGLFAVGGSTANDLEALQLGGHDPRQRGFTVQNVELVLDGAVDPFFRGQGNVILFIDPEGETQLELEEAYLETMSLPANLQVKAGQYFTEFGRHNPTHPHTWGFVDTPLLNGRFFGEDGLRNPGARVSWLAPTPFYSELFFSVQNSHGETATSFRAGEHGEEEEEGLPFAYREAENDRGVKHVSDLLFTPRYAVSFDLTDSQVLLLGASAAFGPNSSGQRGNTYTRIYGADLTWKWKSPRHTGGFPFVTWQTEGMLRRYRAGFFDWDEEGNGGDADLDGFVDEGILVDTATGAQVPAVFPTETLTDYGFYTQLLYGFRKGWVAGLRFDYVKGDRGGYERRTLMIADNLGGGESVGRDPLRAERWRLSPNLTWYPSEFSKLRLQYNYDDRRRIGEDHSVWLQFEFVLGAHAAHKF